MFNPWSIWNSASLARVTCDTFAGFSLYFHSAGKIGARREVVHPARGKCGAISGSSPCMNSTPLYSSRARRIDDGSSLRYSWSAHASITSACASLKKRLERREGEPAVSPLMPAFASSEERRESA